MKRIKKIDLNRQMDFLVSLFTPPEYDPQPPSAKTTIVATPEEVAPTDVPNTNSDAAEEMPQAHEEPEEVPAEELRPLEQLLQQLAGQGKIQPPHTADGVCRSKHESLVILERNDCEVDEIEQGVIGLLAADEEAEADKGVRSYDLWRGRYYEIFTVLLRFPDREEKRDYYFDISRSMFR